MMKYYDELTEINHNPNWPWICDHPYKILVIDCSESGKTKSSLNVIKHQRSDIDKDPLESKYQLLINGRKKVETEILKNTKAFIDYSQKIH